MIGRQAKVFSRRDLRHLRAAAKRGRFPLRDDVIVLLATRAGLRACEIARLTWGMVIEDTLEGYSGLANIPISLRWRRSRRENTLACRPIIRSTPCSRLVTDPGSAISGFTIHVSWLSGGGWVRRRAAGPCRGRASPCRCTSSGYQPVSAGQRFIERNQRGNRRSIDRF